MIKTENLIFPVFLVISERIKGEVEDIVNRNTHLIRDYLIIQEHYNQTCNAPQKNCIQISDMENIEVLKTQLWQRTAASIVASFLSYTSHCLSHALTIG